MHTLYLLMKKQSAIAISLLIFALLFIFTSQQACALGGSTSDLLQSDQSIIYNSFSNSPSRREHKYQFNLNFQVPSGSALQVAACNSLLTQPPLNSQPPQATVWTSPFGAVRVPLSGPGSSWC